MSAHQLALLAGLFLVPALALWLGHRFYRRSATMRAAFWGAVVGHSLATLVVTAVALAPPRFWEDADVGRGLVGYWGLLLGGIGGAAVAVLLTRVRRPR